MTSGNPEVIFVNRQPGYLSGVLEEPLKLLHQYWGYSAFRPLQQDIIVSVLAGCDTLALLPTGGGKSICYQVPALAKPGICIVVSPLIALMKDQVEQLTSRGIKALALHSGMSFRETELTLNNCVHGPYKFLYVSPERLKTDEFRSWLVKMNVNLIAVDEAHCISQWGYDFRPEYLQIAEVREMLPPLPIMAVTATATRSVADDICQKLAMKKPLLFRSSFERANLSFVVRNHPDKHTQLVRITKSLKGSGIVYADTRKATKELAEHLSRNGVPASYYHAGLTADERSKRQEDWLKNRNRVMVCTNAFGMGIDKSDVRFVAHWQMPAGPEAYYQEAGRAGRDGKKAFAVLLYNHEDARQALEKQKLQFPELAAIRKVYEQLHIHLKIAYGFGQWLEASFDIVSFASGLDMPPSKVMACLKMLELQGWIRLSEGISLPSRLLITASQPELYSLQVQSAEADLLVKTLLRLYGGLFDFYTSIREEEIARRLKTNVSRIQQLLSQLNEAAVVEYIPRTDKPRITLLENRFPASQLLFDLSQMKQLAKAAESRLKAVIDYATDTHTCRSLLLRAYFNDEEGLPCGICDNCIAKRKEVLSHTEYERVRTAILAKLMNGSIPLRALTADLPENKKELWIHISRKMIDGGELSLHGETLAKTL